MNHQPPSQMPERKNPTAKFLGFGAGLRPPHYGEILNGEVKSIEWFEAIAENFLGFKPCPMGRPLEVLLQVRRDFPIVMHGVSLSIGGTDAFDTGYLDSLKQLYTKVDPAWISDHLCWTGVHGHNLHDLLPLPYTEETIDHVASRIHFVQEYLGRALTIENVSSYLSYRHSEMTEWEFLTRLHERTGCGLLLDVNNVYVSAFNHGVSAFNHGFRAEDYIRGLPSKAIMQIHLAGHSSGESLLIDTHDAPVCEGVWELYRETVRLLGPISTMIEWDGNIPTLQRLEEEVSHARQIATDVLGTFASEPANRSRPDFHRSAGPA